MRILHTSDWHVGKRLKGVSRLEEQAQVLAEIVSIADREGVDLVLIAGDLFENATPSPDASALVYRTLLGLRGTGAKVVLVAGNHDNQGGLEALRPLLREVGITALGQVARASAGGVVELTTGSGERAVIVLLPFLSQRFVVRADALMAGEAAEHNASYDDRVRRIIASLCASFAPDAVNLVVAHLMVRGGKLGGGERDAQTIFEYTVDAMAFPGSAHYVALGHLHRFQQVGGTLPAYYSGSPLQVDFGESEDAKGVVIVDAVPGVPAKVRFLPLTAVRRLRTVRGTLGELSAIAGTTGDDLLRVLVVEPRRPGLAEEVRAILPNAVEVRIDPEVESNQPEDATPSRSGRTAHELFAQYLGERRYSDPRLTSLFAQLYDEQHAPEAELSLS
jgi:DNA repair protein SbcD/Mre11